MIEFGLLRTIEVVCVCNHLRSCQANAALLIWAVIFIRLSSSYQLIHFNSFSCDYGLSSFLYIIHLPPLELDAADKEVLALTAKLRACEIDLAQVLMMIMLTAFVQVET